jgi:hypothetical protein
MLTIFTTGKAFEGHSGVIQRNALKSWAMLGPDVEVILFGDEAGAAEAARELGVRHEAHVERNAAGLKRIDYYFERAQEIARHEILCYVNCDILLMEDFRAAVKRVAAERREFLMVGRRWDVEMAEAIDFGAKDWAEKVRAKVRAEGKARDQWWIDYFAFPRGMYKGKIPGLVVGRVYWDNWLIWRAWKDGAAVVDASEAVCAVHQNHGYGYHPQGEQGVWTDEQARKNFALAGGYGNLRTIDSANWKLTERGVERNRWYWTAHWRNTVNRKVRPARTFLRTRVWHPLLGWTRPMRHALGLKKAAVVAPGSGALKAGSAEEKETRSRA